MKTLVVALFMSIVSFGAWASDRLAVVELFTSQGCSSCPPADRFLGELSKRSDVLALAYHVDYWDYIGWKDVHAQAAFTDRQHAYAHTFKLRYVYTPQMVVSGRAETSGNRQRTVKNAIEDQITGPVLYEVSVVGSKVSVSGPDNGKNLGLFLVSYHKEVTTDIRRGENRGKTLTDYNIVTNLKKVASLNNGQVLFDIDTSKLDPNQGHAVFVQDLNNLQIFGAARLTL